jgi:hypothetical protein
MPEEFKEEIKEDIMTETVRRRLWQRPVTE